MPRQWFNAALYLLVVHAWPCEQHPDLCFRRGQTFAINGRGALPPYYGANDP